MEEFKTVNILGTDYKIYKRSRDTDRYLEDLYGYCAYHSKEIVYCDIKTVDGWEEDTDKVIEDKEGEILRHEIIHAFLYESGLNDSSSQCESWAKNEEMVDFFAMQLPKIKKICDELMI